MDGRRFDGFTRFVAASAGASPSRRGFVGGLAALAAGLAGIGGAGAQGCPPGQVYRRGVGCVCRTTGRPPGDGDCPCPVGQERCGDGCVHPAAYRTDPANCGACGHVCPAETPVCADGHCAEACTTSTSIAGELTMSTSVVGNTLGLASGEMAYHFDPHPFVHCGGPLTLQLRGRDTDGGTLTNPFLILVAGTCVWPFSSECPNLVAFNDDDLCDGSLDSLLSFADLAAGPYTAIVHGYYAVDLGSYTLEINRPLPRCPF